MLGPGDRFAAIDATKSDESSRSITTKEGSLRVRSIGKENRNLVVFKSVRVGKKAVNMPVG